MAIKWNREYISRCNSWPEVTFHVCTVNTFIQYIGRCTIYATECNAAASNAILPGWVEHGAHICIHTYMCGLHSNSCTCAHTNAASDMLYALNVDFSSYEIAWEVQQHPAEASALECTSKWSEKLRERARTHTHWERHERATTHRKQHKSSTKYWQLATFWFFLCQFAFAFGIPFAHFFFSLHRMIWCFNTYAFVHCNIFFFVFASKSSRTFNQFRIQKLNVRWLGGWQVHGTAKPEILLCVHIAHTEPGGHRAHQPKCYILHRTR